MKLILTISLLLFTSCATVKENASRNFEAAIIEPPTPIGSVR